MLSRHRRIIPSLMAFIDLTHWKKVHPTASSEIKRLGRLVSQRRMPRETEKPHSQKDQDGHGVMKSEYFEGFRTQTTNWRIFLSRWLWSGECSFFLDRVFFRQFFGFRTHVVATTVCTTGRCTHSLVARTFFCAQRAHCVLRTSSCVSHTRMAPVSVKRCFAHVSLISPCRLLPSHDPPIFAVPWRSLRDHSWLRLQSQSHPHDLAVLSSVKSAGRAPLCTSIAKFGYLAKSDANTGYEPKEFDKITSVDDDATLINDPDLNEISDFSKNTHENTGQFDVPTVFWILCFARFSWLFCSSDGKQRMHAIGKPLLDRETEERAGFAISDAESMSKKGQRNGISVSLKSLIKFYFDEPDLREHLERRARRAIVGENSILGKLYSTEKNMEIQDSERRNSEYAVFES